MTFYDAIVVYRLDVAAAILAIAAGAACLFRDYTNRKWLVDRSQLLFFLPIVALILIGGIALSEFGTFREQALNRRKLILHAREWSDRLNLLGHSAVNSTTPPDDPSYLKMIQLQKEWLQTHPEVNDVYSMRRSANGDVVLIVDSETDYDRNGRYEGEREGRTAIGEPYEPTANILTALEGAVVYDEVPYSDRWGTWVSAYAPIRDTQGRLDGIAGVDVNASRMLRNIASVRLTALAVTTLIAWCYLWLTARRIRATGQIQNGSYLSPWIVVAMGGLVSVLVGFLIFEGVGQSERSRFEVSSQRFAGEIQSTFESASRLLEAGRGLFEASMSVERDEWRSFVLSQRLQDLPGVMGLGVVLKLAPDEEESFLKQTRLDGRPDYKIKRLTPQTDALWPVVYIEPFEDNQRAEGLDMASEPRRRQAADESMRLGRGLITHPVKLIQDKTGQSSFLYFLPIYKKDAATRTADEREAACLGWIYAPIVIYPMMESRIKTAASGLEFEVFDIFEGRREQIFSYEQGARKGIAGIGHRVYRHTVPMTIGGLTWEVNFHNNPMFTPAWLVWLPWIAFMIGLGITMLCFLLVFTLNHQREDVLKLADRMTVEFKEAKNQAVEARERANQANRAKSEFLANMSHEIRTPLNAVIGFADLIKQTPLSGEQSEYLDTIQQSGHHLLAIVNDVLDMAKIESGRVVLENISFDLRNLLGSCLKMIESRVNLEAVKLEFEYADALPRYFRGDPTRIRQSILNLLGNAAKFTSGGSIKLRARAGSGAPVNPGAPVPVMIHVQDTGPGIPADKLQAIFEAFVQVDGSITRKYGGTGLGLAITKKLLEMMGGRITAQSEVGKGTNFMIALVLQTSAPDQHPGAAESVVDPSVLRGRRIAVIDPMPGTAQRLSKSLEAVGVTPCESFAAIGEWAAARPSAGKGVKAESNWDVVVVEMFVGGSEPDPIIRRIRDELGPVPRLIVMSSQPEPGQAKLASDAGADGYLSKPFKDEELIRIMESLLMMKGRPGAIVTRHTLEDASLVGTRVLVAEDNPVNQKLIRLILSNKGVDVEVVGDGTEAVERLRAGAAYDLCLMDVQMPKMGGLEATRLIRGELKNPIPIIALTANVFREDREACIHAGMNDFLSKPINADKLFATIRQIRQAGLAAPLGPAPSPRGA